MAKQTDKSGINSELGMAAVGFACFLVVVSTQSPSGELQQALRYFAVAIPLIIASAFLRLFEPASQSVVKTIVRTLKLASGILGDIGCGIGVYWMFRHVSPPTAKLFLITALVSWLVVGLLGLLAAEKRKAVN